MSNTETAASDIKFGTPSLSIVTITPAIAEKWLAKTYGDRKPNTKSFERLVTDLRADHFLFTADAIKFTVKSEVLDGLNRLRAVIKTGINITVLVATGVTPEARNVIDTGATFTLKHALELNSVKHAANVASALKAIQAWERDEHTAEPKSGATTNSSSLAFLAANPIVETIAHEAAKYASKIPTLTTRQVSSLIWAMDKLDRDERTAFFAKLVSGANLSENSPILRLRNLLLDEQLSASKRSSRFISAVTIKAWNAWRNGSDVRVLNFVGGGTRPQTFPLPI